MNKLLLFIFFFLLPLFSRAEVVLSARKEGFFDRNQLSLGPKTEFSQLLIARNSVPLQLSASDRSPKIKLSRFLIAQDEDSFLEEDFKDIEGEEDDKSLEEDFDSLAGEEAPDNFDEADFEIEEEDEEEPEDEEEEEEEEDDEEEMNEDDF